VDWATAARAPIIRARRVRMIARALRRAGGIAIHDAAVVGDVPVVPARD
jgi:hypothetical protein